MNTEHEKLSIKEDIDALNETINFLDELSTSDNLSKFESSQCTEASNILHKRVTLLKVNYLKQTASGLELEYLEDIDLAIRLSSYNTTKDKIGDV